MTRSRLLASVLAALLALSACGTGEEDSLVVLAASSLVDVAGALTTAWDGGDVLVSDAGSQVLAAQVRGGADADVLLLADPDVADALHDEGLATAPTPVATNGLAIVVAPGARERVRDVADLAAPGIRLVLADAAVPLGGYTREGLARAEAAGIVPPGTADAVLAVAVSFEDAARVVLAKVTTGEADAAVVYATDAAAAGDRVATVPWPAAADVRATYTAQRVTGARGGADDLLTFLTGAEAAATWRRYGFTPRVTPP